MKAHIKAFGKDGMHIYIPKGSGYKIGEEIELSQPKVAPAPLSREEVKNMIECAIEKAKGGY